MITTGSTASAARSAPSLQSLSFTSVHADDTSATAPAITTASSADAPRRRCGRRGDGGPSAAGRDDRARGRAIVGTYRHPSHRSSATVAYLVTPRRTSDRRVLRTTATVDPIPTVAAPPRPSGRHLLRTRADVGPTPTVAAPRHHRT